MFLRRCFFSTIIFRMLVSQALHCRHVRAHIYFCSQSAASCPSNFTAMVLQRRATNGVTSGKTITTPRSTTTTAGVMPRPRALKRLRFGSHFSGMESWGLALQTLGVAHDHSFACDSHAPCRRLIQKVFKPGHIFENVKDCCSSAAPRVDLLCSSPPCQPFSSAGTGHGEKDSETR